MRSLALLLLLLLVTSTASADLTDGQKLKLYGHMPGVKLADVENAAVDEDLCEQVLGMREAEGHLNCMHPDFPDRELANADAEILAEMFELPKTTCETFIELHRRMLEATGSGSWPAKCYPAVFPDNHALQYYAEVDTFPSHFKRQVNDDEWQDLVDANVWNVDTIAQAKAKWDRGNLLETALALVDEAYRRIGCAHIRVDTGPDGDHNVHIKSVPIPGSTIGVAWFNNGTCGDHVNHHIDSGYRPGLHALCNLLCHEFGHNHNLPHTFNGQSSTKGWIMSYSPRYPFVGFSTGEAPYDRTRDSSWPQLTRQYGGEPVPATEDPTDPGTPDPTPGEGNFAIAVGDVISMMLDGRKVSMSVLSIEGDDGPGTAKRIEAELAKVPAYDNKDRDRKILVVLYTSFGKAVNQGESSIEDAQANLMAMRTILIGAANIPKWQGVFDIADGVTTGDGLLAVAEGLGGGEFLSPELIEILVNLIADIAPDKPIFQIMIKLILSIIEGIDLGAEEGVPAEAPAMFQKQAAMRPTSVLETLALAC